MAAPVAAVKPETACTGAAANDIAPGFDFASGLKLIEEAKVIVGVQ